MADITMCFGGDCPLKDTCYRYKAMPSEFRQAYFFGEPFVGEDDNVTCEYYWSYNEKN